MKPSGQIAGAAAALVAGVVLSASSPALAAKTFQVYQQPKAAAAPTKPVSVKDLDGSVHAPAANPAAPATTAQAQPANSELEAIISQTGEKNPPAAPDPLPPLQIIPPPSEILSAQNDPQAGFLKMAQHWSKQWYELIHAGVMLAVLLLVGLMYLTGRGQYKILKRSVATAEMAANSARQAADAAQLAATMQTALERPYVFLEPNIQGSVSAANGPGEPAMFTIKFMFRNHGKTPAIIADLQASGSYWSAGYPDTLFAASHNASQGMLISPGEKSSPFTLVFNVGIDDLQHAYNGTGQLLFWGKLLYRDMYGELRETAFCRCYRFDEKAFRLAQAEKLNYHT